jgi:peroxiredoxin
LFLIALLPPQVIVVTQDSPSDMAAWAQEAGCDKERVVAMSDSRGYLTRLLGVEITGGAVKNLR